MANVSINSSTTPIPSDLAVAYITELTAHGVVLTWDDATWILTSSFIIFTMQSGFGLLEAGTVSIKNEANIMVKNAVDVIFGGLSFWAVGYGLAFGTEEGTNAFYGYGLFFVDATTAMYGSVFSTYIFQLSFATTSTTIVSGAVAERMRLTSYILFSFLNTIVYVFPAHWLWGKFGFLNEIGVVDIAGAAGVHLVGGVSAFVAAAFVRPRLGRFDKSEAPQMGSPTNAMIGMFMLWWGWLGFNCGSTFGISGFKWKIAAKAAVNTINSSLGGGAAAILLSKILTRNRSVKISSFVNGLLSSLVSVTEKVLFSAICAVVKPWLALLIGAIGATFCILAELLIVRLKVDDPVGASAVHGIAGLWAMVSVGLFSEVLANLVITVWSATTTLLLLWLIDRFAGLTFSDEEQALGSDFIEHNIKSWDGSGEGDQLAEEIEMNRREIPENPVNPDRPSSSLPFPYRIENHSRSKQKLTRPTTVNGQTPVIYLVFDLFRHLFSKQTTNSEVVNPSGSQSVPIPKRPRYDTGPTPSIAYTIRRRHSIGHFSAV